MPTNNLQRQKQEWTVRFVRFSVVVATLLLSALLVFVGSTVQAPV